MDNQHKKISGYRDLTQDEIDGMNELKELAAKCGDALEKVKAIPDVDQHAAALGATNLQQGFMWAIRAIARPTTFG